MLKMLNNEVTEIRKLYRKLDRNVIILARKLEDCET
jgi:uncharacterized coiled-coil protein SlyX